jgi:hypothetical protein
MLHAACHVIACGMPCAVPFAACRRAGEAQGLPSQRLRQAAAGLPRGSPTAARVQQPGRLGSVPLRAYGGWRRPIGSRGQHAAPAITKARVPLTCQLCGVHGRRSVPTRAPQRCRVKLEHALAPLVAGLRSSSLVKHNRVEPMIALGVTGMTCFVARQARARARQRQGPVRNGNAQWHACLPPVEHAPADDLGVRLRMRLTA